MKKNIEYFETYSCLAYNIVGFIAYHLYGDLLFSLGMHTVGIGSFIYHLDKSANRKKHTIWKFDWWSIAFVNTIVAGLLFDSVFAWKVLIIFHVLYSYLFLGKTSVYIEVGISSIVCLVAVYLNKSFSEFLVIFGSILLSLVVRSKDKDIQQIEHHDSPWHTAWHFLSALSYYLVFYLDI